MNDLNELNRAARQDIEDAEAIVRARLAAERQGLIEREFCVVCEKPIIAAGSESPDPEQQTRCSECVWDVEEWEVGEFNRGSDGYALVIDPENRKVWARGHVGNGRSFDEIYRRVIAPALETGLAGDQARQVVMTNLDKLDEIASLYEGSESRNGNETGSWSDLERAEVLAQSLADSVNGVARLWSAEEWFTEGLPVEEVIGHDSIAAYVAAEVAGASGDVVLNAEEMEGWVRDSLEGELETAESALEDIEGELEDEDDEEEREEIEERAQEARGLVNGIRRLLADEEG